jgi:aspartyl-tRNA(Asn)/glutamyl-tRNA(Gln) amidotransferase subunit C
MAITRDEVQRIARLGRLRLTVEEESRFAKQLGKVLDYVAVLQKVDTSGIEPMAHALDVVNAFRDDRVTNQPNPEALLNNAPAADDNFFQVLKIIE